MPVRDEGRTLTGVAIALDGLFGGRHDRRDRPRGNQRRQDWRAAGARAICVYLLMGMLVMCDIAATLANTEALFGQLYLVTVIGVLVSRIPSVRRAEV